MPQMAVNVAEPYMVQVPLPESSLRSAVQAPSSLEIVDTLDDDCVLIAGGGPVGLLLATVLAYFGVRSVVLERNTTTTKWPKMDLTNARSMEMFRRLGLADSIREQGVPSHIPQPVLVSSGLSKENAITSWLHPSVDQYREQIAACNDGTLPLEPWQRLSQAIFERLLKSHCDDNPLISTRFGWKVESAKEHADRAQVTACNISSGEQRVFYSKYAAGCDGASSRMRRDLSIPLDGGPIREFMLLVHFKSRDLTRLHAQGQFWHIFFLGEHGLHGAIIAQDEVDTWTTHLALPLDADHTQISSLDAIYTVLGGLNDKYEIKVDEILVRSTYRPSIAVARQYQGPLGRIYLAGDAAHQNIPTGGYGMNMGLADAFDLGWKLASTIKQHGGQGTLQSYELDRRPVALMSIERSGVHMMVHMKTVEIIGPDIKAIDAPTEEGSKIREALVEHYRLNDGENTDLGVEMGYRYVSSLCVLDEKDKAANEPEWTPSRYIPSTWPGARAPHVFLKDGSAIFDYYGKYFTLVEFADDYDTDTTDRGVQFLLKEAVQTNVPLKHVRLVEEKHAYSIWERRLVLIRPDGHVAWRSDGIDSLLTARRIIGAIAGFDVTPKSVQAQVAPAADVPDIFSATVGTEVQSDAYKMEKMGEFQQ